MPYKNPEDQKAYREANKEKIKAKNRKYREANREEIRAQSREYQKLRSSEHKAIIDQYAKDTGNDKCVKCGTDEDLEWDHIDPKTKLFKVSGYSRAMKDLLAEAKKCQRLCKPCHIEKTRDNGEYIAPKK